MEAKAGETVFHLYGKAWVLRRLPNGNVRRVEVKERKFPAESVEFDGSSAGFYEFGTHLPDE